MNTDEFSFILPTELIAQNPVSPRDSSRLLSLDKSSHQTEELIFRDIWKKLRKDDVLVFNRSKVIPARILFQIDHKKAEILLIRKIQDDEWSVMVRPGKIFKPGSLINIDENLDVEVIEITEGGLRRVKFRLKNGSFDKYIYHIGTTPFPPYINNTQAVSEDYQTIYAKTEGSVAAPTAGLHFSQDVFDKLQLVGVKTAFVTLHIGPGTFLPVKTLNIEEHKMHSEWFEMDYENAEILNSAYKNGNRIIAVGTTSVRVLESNFRNGCFRAEQADTEIFIRPGYVWSCVNGLLTNFHLPKSTLMMLVCAFAGRDFAMKAYSEAIEKNTDFIVLATLC